MIRHCVFIRYRPTISSAEKASIHADITALMPKIEGMLAVHIGANVSPETGMDKGFADGFIVDFADAAARDRYLVDEGHQAAGSRIVAAAGGVDGVFVYDLEIAG
ncbi:stress responsive protein [Xaviernesmea oryzae]|uniref:Stress responsive protein n=1 Tax=Xaviernesmea oryzae TaxID=464029 RepID=A0A1Q9B383_9HYPH|nr:Dabb family protein [Xaviernesmea oryzae]OLP62469.1 stress responsive protein [Xaviernesmea oryzae]SEM17491.1 Stress responsive A/B Barrel Domain [Xaviernesmea oryzae]